MRRVPEGFQPRSFFTWSISVPLVPVHVDCKSLAGLRHRDLSILESVLCVTFLLPFIFWHKMGIVKSRKFRVRSKIFLLSPMVQDYGTRSADICVVTQAVGQAGYSLFMCLPRSLWSAQATNPQETVMIPRYRTSLHHKRRHVSFAKNLNLFLALHRWIIVRCNE